jgi:hypothetical protein
MSISRAAPATTVEAEERRIQLAKTIVLRLACVVALTLVTALTFAIYSYASDRPVKELFKSR